MVRFLLISTLLFSALFTQGQYNNYLKYDYEWSAPPVLPNLSIVELDQISKNNAIVLNEEMSWTITGMNMKYSRIIQEKRAQEP